MRATMSVLVVGGLLLLLVVCLQGPDVKAVEATGTYGEGTTLICDNSNQRVIEVDEDGTILWCWDSNGLYPVDAERLSGGITMIVEVSYSARPYYGRVIEVDSHGNIIWEMGGLKCPYDVERLDNGNTLIACNHGHRVIEVEPDHDVVWEASNNLKNTDRPFLRHPVDVERLDNGNTLITDMYNDRIIEIEPDFDVVWETPWRGWLSLQDAKRLDNGNTLICSSQPGWNKVLEVDSSFNIVWEYHTYFPTDAHRLPNGNTLIAGGCGNYVKEVDPDKNVVWYLTGVTYPCDVERLVSTVPPTAEAGSDQTEYLGTTISFDGSGSSDSDGTIVSYDWDFGDSTTHGSGATPTHLYSDHGVYTVTLTVTDDDGDTDTDTCTITILNNPPVADAGADVTLIVGEVGSFDGSGSSDIDGTIASYSWNFGDGSPASSGISVSHSYSSAGTYTVTLTVTDDDGATDTDTLTVTVLTPSQAIDLLIEVMEAMDLPDGTENSLEGKLDNAIKSLSKGNDKAASNQLEAFINEVEAQSGKKITEEQAEILMDYAQWTIDNM